MDATPPQFIRQTGELLFPAVLYNRPITRQGAGRLLLVGGHSGDFSLATMIHQFALAAGVGECNVLLPDTLAHLASGAPGTYFAASSPSGSLSTAALGRILELSETADAVALGASLSGNSDTAMLLEKLASELERPPIFFADALDLLRHRPDLTTGNEHALIIATMPEVFKLCGKLGVPINIREGGGLINKLEIINDLRVSSRCTYVIYGSEIIVAAQDKPLVVTPINYHLATTPALFYAVLATFWLQNSKNPLEGLATGAWLIRSLGDERAPHDHPTANLLATTIDALLRKAED